MHVFYYFYATMKAIKGALKARQYLQDKFNYSKYEILQHNNHNKLVMHNCKSLIFGNKIKLKTFIIERGAGFLLRHVGRPRLYTIYKNLPRQKMNIKQEDPEFLLHL